MPLPQILAVLAACERRDAAISLQALHTAHAAHAPLIVGKEGGKVYERWANYLKAIVFKKPAPDPEQDAFAKMVAEAELMKLAKKPRRKPPQNG